jgi:PAS domain S-box-containing protein
MAIKHRGTCRYLQYLSFSLFLLLISNQGFSINSFKTSLDSFSLSSVAVLSTSTVHFIFTLLGALLVVCTIVIYFSVRLKRVNGELIEKNRQIVEINNDLQKTNNELAIQKELITKEHYESDKFYGMLVQSANDGISFYDREWNLKYANLAFYSMIGLNSNSYNLINPLDLIHPDDKDSQLKKVQELVNCGFFESELRLRHKDGHYVSLSSRSVTVKNDNGEVLGALTILRDISRLKQVHEDLIRSNVAAEASNRLKSSFLANISHEIRTPLNSVVGFSNLLLGNNIPDEVKEEYIEHINHNSEKLLQIIGDIIDLSRLESSQIEITYEEANLNTIVNEIIEETRQIIRRNEKSIILNVKNHFEDNGSLIFTDRIWLKRILNHLMDNAVKFTLDGSIEFSYYRENENIVFKIRDTGIGINEEIPTGDRWSSSSF